MKDTIDIGIVGDYGPGITAHRAVRPALDLAGQETGVVVRCEWLPTAGIRDTQALGRVDGLWCVPGSPYQSLEGALRAISYAREQRVPFLGTCGGFQHAILEYARNVLGWSDAQHAESDPGAGRPVISALQCALVETSNLIRLFPGSRIASIYGRSDTVESYHCSYGLNPEFRAAMSGGSLAVSAEDASGEVRAIELRGHPFYLATLFQPERAALESRVPPLVAALVRACAASETDPADFDKT